ncbi:MAG: tetratricopeptide repeat protein, partial [Myxococcota bacterium]
VIQFFEVLKERFPQMELSFTEIMDVGKAYAQQKEHERAMMVFRATLQALFLKELNIAKTLEQEGQHAEAYKFIEQLWWRYPDLQVTQEALYALAQSLYQYAERCNKITQYHEKANVFRQSKHLFTRFLWSYPDYPTADLAAYTKANIFMELKQYKQAVAYLRTIAKRFPNSQQLADIHYLQAYAHYLQRQYKDAQQLLIRVSQKRYPDGNAQNKKSPNRYLARYLIAQIFHAQQDPKQALQWYTKVKTHFGDARAQVDYLSQKQLRIPEVTTALPNQDIQLKVQHQNIKTIQIHAYYVDLMKLYLLKKDLSNVTRIHLSGIRPTYNHKHTLGTNQEFTLRTTAIKLPLERDGAYLVVLKSKERDISGIVLRSSLKLDPQQDKALGQITVHLSQRPKKAPVARATIRVVGSLDRKIRSGKTDLRGI